MLEKLLMKIRIWTWTESQNLTTRVLMKQLLPVFFFPLLQQPHKSVKNLEHSHNLHMVGREELFPILKNKKHPLPCEALLSCSCLLDTTICTKSIHPFASLVLMLWFLAAACLKHKCNSEDVMEWATLHLKVGSLPEWQSHEFHVCAWSLTGLLSSSDASAHNTVSMEKLATTTMYPIFNIFITMTKCAWDAPRPHCHAREMDCHIRLPRRENVVLIWTILLLTPLHPCLIQEAPLNSSNSLCTHSLIKVLLTSWRLSVPHAKFKTPCQSTNSLSSRFPKQSLQQTPENNLPQQISETIFCNRFLKTVWSHSFPGLFSLSCHMSW